MVYYRDSNFLERKTKNQFSNAVTKENRYVYFPWP
jgi:hypothetical protein